MSEVSVTIGGCNFAVTCQAGEEGTLQAAAVLLDAEATVLKARIERLPESRMLLMSGLMLADKATDMEKRLRGMEAKLAAAEAELEQLRNAPPPRPERIEVPVIPDRVGESMAEIAARAEAIAEVVEERAKKMA